MVQIIEVPLLVTLPEWGGGGGGVVTCSGSVLVSCSCSARLMARSTAMPSPWMHSSVQLEGQAHTHSFTLTHPLPPHPCSSSCEQRASCDPKEDLRVT